MEPASIRYKNPGAMWGSPRTVKWGAAKKAVTLNDGKGQGNNIAVFPTYVQGICAQIDLWRTSPAYKNQPFAKAISVWSGGNSVESYIHFVTARVPGMTRDTVMNDTFWNSEMAIPFLKAQAWHEAGKPYPAPDADWIEARKIAMGGQKTQPSPTPAPIPLPKPSEAPKDQPSFFKKWWKWITGGVVGGGGVVSGVTIDSSTLWAAGGFLAIAFVVFLGYVYLIPPRGKLRKGIK